MSFYQLVQSMRPTVLLLLVTLTLVDQLHVNDYVEAIIWTYGAKGIICSADLSR
jgi:hypothetical protein